MPFPANIKYFVTDNHNNKKETDSLQTPNYYFIKILRQKPPERASLSALLCGSVTIEAALILPFFLLALASYLFLLQVLQIQLQIEQGLYGVSKNISVKAYASKNFGLDFEGLEGFALTIPYVEREVEEAIGDPEFCGERSYGYSKVMGEQEVVDIIVSYKVALPFRVFRLPDLEFVQRARTKAWTGYVSGSMDGNEEDQYVYVTVNGTVYHLTLSCSHIQLSIQKIGKEQAGDLRNEQGGKYHACERCVKNVGTISYVYITNTGDRFHNSLSCSGLKRGIQTVHRKDVGSRSACSRCGGSK